MMIHGECHLMSPELGRVDSSNGFPRLEKPPVSDSKVRNAGIGPVLRGCIETTPRNRNDESLRDRKANITPKGLYPVLLNQLPAEE
jgi:hypothetical protein